MWRTFATQSSTWRKIPPGESRSASKPAVESLIDTPGIIKKTKNTLNRFMVDNAKSLLGDVDLAVLLIEAGKFTEADEHVVSLLKGRAGKTICGLTKIDLVKKKINITLLVPYMIQMRVMGDLAEPHRSEKPTERI